MKSLTKYLDSAHFKTNKNKTSLIKPKVSTNYLINLLDY